MRNPKSSSFYILVAAAYIILTGQTIYVPQPTLSLSFNPPNPSIPSTSLSSTFVTQIVPAWSNNRQFTGTVAFSAPNFDDGGCFSIDGSLNLRTACDLSADGGTVQNITVTATQ